MRKDFRPRNAVSDISDALRRALFWLFIESLIFGFIILVLWGAHNSADNKYQAYNEFIAVANEKLDAEQRAALVPVVDNVAEDDLGEDGLFIKLTEPTSFGTMMKNSWVSMLLLYLAIWSLIASICYWVEHNRTYYLADLPLRTGWGWYVLISNFITWPVLLVSLILFLRFKHRKKQAQESEEPEKRLPKVRAIFDEQAFVDFYFKVLPIEKQIESAKRKVSETETEISQYAAELKDAQSRLSEHKANLNELCDHERIVVNDKRTKDQILNDFAQIKAMHGVQQIYVEKNQLCVRVRADYVYGKKLYDLGDYVIKISGYSSGNYRADMVRSNIKGSKDGYSNYGTSDFCFGNRGDEIYSYLAEGRIVEAMELMIESLNHINSGSMDDRYEVIRKLSSAELKELKNN